MTNGGDLTDGNSVPPRAAVFTLPLLALFVLDFQVINPLAERVCPFLYNVLVDRGLDLERSRKF